LWEDRDLVSTFFTPDNSSTILTPPPAITPVPGKPVSSKPGRCRNARSLRGQSSVFESYLDQIFLALVIPFWIASCTSLALPVPTPTWPFSSPTTTKAANEKALSAFDDFSYAGDIYYFFS